MKIGDEVYVHGYIDEIRQDTVIIRNDGGYFGTVPSEVVDQEETLQNLTKPNKSDLIVKGAGEIKDGLYNIKDGKLFKYKANGGTVRTYQIVSADRPTGHWTEKEVFDNQDSEVIGCYQSARCSHCGKYHTTPYSYYFDNYNFCPNCGAKMQLSNEDLI